MPKTFQKRKTDELFLTYDTLSTSAPTASKISETHLAGYILSNVLTVIARMQPRRAPAAQARPH